MHSHSSSPTDTSPKSPFPSFPEAAFTGVFASLRSLLSPTSEAPDAFYFGSALAALSFLLGRDTGLRWSTGTLFPNINVGLVGETGLARKSTAISDIKQVLLNHFVPPRLPGDSPPQLVVLDGGGTGEGFTEAVADAQTEPKDGSAPQVITGRRSIILVHEFGELLAKAARDQAGSLVKFALDSFDGHSPISHVTKSKITTVTDGTVVFLAASTIGNLTKSLSASSVHTGLMNRFLWLAGGRKPPLYFRPSIDEVQLGHLRDEIVACLATVKGREMALDPSAHAAQRAHYGAHYARDAADSVIQATSRADIMALKIAMALAISNRTTAISASHIDAAWNIIQYSEHVVRALVDQLPDAGFGALEDRLFEKAKEIAARQGGTFTLSDVFQRLKSKTLGWRTIEIAFRSVVARGDILSVPGSPSRYHIKGELPEGEAPVPAPAPVPSTPAPYYPVSQTPPGTGKPPTAPAPGPAPLPAPYVPSAPTPPPQAPAYLPPAPAPLIPGLSHVETPTSAPPFVPKPYEQAASPVAPTAVPLQPWLVPPSAGGHGT